MYDKLMEEIKAAGSPDMWVPWHEASHYIANDRDRHGKWKADSPTFTAVVDRIRRVFPHGRQGALQLVPRPGGVETLSSRRRRGEAGQSQDAELHGGGEFRRDARRRVRTRQDGTTAFFPPSAAARHTPSDRPRASVEWRHGIPQVPEELRGKPGGDAPRISIIAWGWVDQDRDDVTAFDNCPTTDPHGDQIWRCVDEQLLRALPIVARVHCSHRRRTASSVGVNASSHGRVFNPVSSSNLSRACRTAASSRANLARRSTVGPHPRPSQTPTSPRRTRRARATAASARCTRRGPRRRLVRLRCPTAPSKISRRASRSRAWPCVATKSETAGQNAVQVVVPHVPREVHLV